MYIIIYIAMSINYSSLYHYYYYHYYHYHYYYCYYQRYIHHPVVRGADLLDPEVRKMDPSRTHMSDVVDFAAQSKLHTNDMQLSISPLPLPLFSLASCPRGRRAALRAQYLDAFVFAR